MNLILALLSYLASFQSYGSLKELERAKPSWLIVQQWKRREKWFWTIPVCVCVSVRLSVLLYLFPQTVTGVSVNRSSWNFRGMFGYMGTLRRNNFLYDDSSTRLEDNPVGMFWTWRAKTWENIRSSLNFQGTLSYTGLIWGHEHYWFWTQSFDPITGTRPEIGTQRIRLR